MHPPLALVSTQPDDDLQASAHTAQFGARRQIGGVAMRLVPSSKKCARSLGLLVALLHGEKLCAQPTIPSSAQGGHRQPSVAVGRLADTLVHQLEARVRAFQRVPVELRDERATRVGVVHLATQFHDIDALVERILTASDAGHSIAALALRGEAHGFLGRQAGDAFTFLCVRHLERLDDAVEQNLIRLERFASRIERSNSTQALHIREVVADRREQAAQHRSPCPEPLTWLLDLSSSEERRAIADDAASFETMRRTLTPSVHAWRALERLHERGRWAVEAALPMESGFVSLPGMFDVGSPGLTLIEGAFVATPGLAREWGNR